MVHIYYWHSLNCFIIFSVQLIKITIDTFLSFPMEHISLMHQKYLNFIAFLTNINPKLNYCISILLYLTKYFPKNMHVELERCNERKKTILECTKKYQT